MAGIINSARATVEIDGTEYAVPEGVPESDFIKAVREGRFPPKAPPSKPGKVPAWISGKRG